MEMHWSRLYYLSSVEVLSINVEVSKGSELVAPPRLVVEGVTLGLEGTLRGVTDVAVVNGGGVAVSSTGHTDGSATGVFSFSRMTLNGLASTSVSLTLNADSTLTADDTSVLYGTVTMNTGSTLKAVDLGVDQSSVNMNGKVYVNASRLLNLTSTGSFNGKGRSSYTSTLGPGTLRGRPAARGIRATTAGTVRRRTAGWVRMRAISARTARRSSRRWRAQVGTVAGAAQLCRCRCPESSGLTAPSM